jgi:hypothetical protein
LQDERNSSSEEVATELVDPVLVALPELLEPIRKPTPDLFLVVAKLGFRRPVEPSG